MNAVATPASTRPAGTSSKKAPAKTPSADLTTAGGFTPAAIKAAFGQVETLLNEAYLTDEDHGWSGDSDRLLGIAHDLADEAERCPPIGPPMSRVAFDIAALVRAARLVPGDGESPQRKALIDQAAVHLNWLTECDLSGEDCCDPGVPRPAPPTVTGSNADADEAECLELARQATYEIQKLAETMQTVMEQVGNEEDQPIAHGLMARIIVLTGIAYNAAALHGLGRSKSRPLKELQRVFKGGF